MQFNGDYFHNLKMPIGMKQKLVSVKKQNKIGWKPNYSLKDGLKKTIEYYLDNII